MRTITTARGETRSISIAAPPAVVLGIVGDPLRLPQWAPDFAVSVAPDGKHWRVDTGTGELIVDVVTSHDAGTVDLIRPENETGAGARMRAIPSGGGTELVFTILFPPDTAEAAVIAQMDVVVGELETIRGLAEAAVGSR